jgi:hypothetical protein
MTWSSARAPEESGRVPSGSSTTPCRSRRLRAAHGEPLPSLRRLRRVAVSLAS